MNIFGTKFWGKKDKDKSAKKSIVEPIVKEEEEEIDEIEEEEEELINFEEIEANFNQPNNCPFLDQCIITMNVNDPYFDYEFLEDGHPLKIAFLTGDGIGYDEGSEFEADEDEEEELSSMIDNAMNHLESIDDEYYETDGPPVALMIPEEEEEPELKIAPEKIAENINKAKQEDIPGDIEETEKENLMKEKDALKTHSFKVKVITPIEQPLKELEIEKKEERPTINIKKHGIKSQKYDNGTLVTKYRDGTIVRG